LLAEIEDRRDEPEVAYRDGERWVRRLVKSAPIASDRGHRLSRTRGFYLVTGGTGGVGTEICRQLLRTSNAPLLLVGRTPASAMDSEQRVALAALQTRGNVLYEAADVSNDVALEHAVAGATARFGMPLAGVIHLAGAFEPRLLIHHSTATLAPELRAKIDGGWNLHRLLLTHPDAVFIACSSVNGHLGGHSAGAYAAANAFLDGLAEYHVRELGRRAYSLAFSLWDGVGLSRTYAVRESAERRGFRALSAEQGWLSFLTATSSEPGHVLIGLDAGNPHIQMRVDAPATSSRVMAQWVRGTATNGVVFPPFVDRFGTAVHVSVSERVNNSAPTEHRAPHSNGANGRASAFNSDLERSMAAIWKSVLPGDVGPNDNFFDAGGNSVLVAQTCRAMQQGLGRPVPVTDIYRFPTLRLLAAYYAGDHASDRAALDDSEARGQIRRARRQERSRRDL
jgi:NAD(P)-dependent dehydrogenase (short-subunit alcohol dehydrogenase family)